MESIIGIDVGGTTVKIGKFQEGKLVDTFVLDTDLSFKGSTIIPSIIHAVKDFTKNDQVVGIGVGLPGPVVFGRLLAAHNLGLENLDAQSIFEAAFPNAIIRITNDANAATLGEQKKGGGMGYRDLVFVTLGTGIGGGVIIQDHLLEGYTGSAGEIGHVRVDFNNKRKCTCGLYDCVEEYASATGVVKTALEKIETLQIKTMLTEQKLTSKYIFDCAKAGDILALHVVEDMVEKLATALSQIANTINPEAFVIGGGVSKAGAFLLDRLQKRFNELAFFSVRDTAFHLARLGSDAGMYGCCALIEEALT